MLTHKCTLCCLIISLFVCVAIIFLNSNTLTNNKTWYHYPVSRNHSTEELDHLIESTHQNDELLEKKENAQDVVCCGDVLGALNQPFFPWDGDVDFCITFDDLGYVDEGYVEQLFGFNGITLRHDSRDDVYHVTHMAKPAVTWLCWNSKKTVPSDPAFRL